MIFHPAETSTVEKQLKENKSSFKVANFCVKHGNLLTFITTFPPTTLQLGNEMYYKFSHVALQEGTRISLHLNIRDNKVVTKDA